MGSSASYSSGGISGMYVSGGIIGIIVAISGMILAIKKIKYAFVTGALNFINGLGYMLGWFGMNGVTGLNSSFNSSFGDSTVKASFDLQIGLYLFVLASLVYVIFTLQYLKGKKVE